MYLGDLTGRTRTIGSLGLSISSRFSVLRGIDMRIHYSTSLVRSRLNGIVSITALFLVMLFTLQEASGNYGASQPAQFRGEYENLKARFTNVMEKVEEARIGRGVVDVQELSEIARTAKSLSVEVKAFVSARDDEFHQFESAHLFRDGDTRMSGRSALLAIYYACQAIERTMLTESEYQGNSHLKPDFVQRIQERYKEEWKLADQIVTKSGFGN